LDSPQRPAIQPERIVVSREPSREDVSRPTPERWREETRTIVAKSPTAPERLLTAPTRSEHTQAAAQETPAEPIVRVSIGRLQVRAPAPSEPARRRSAPPPSGRLERYLEERNRGRAK